MNESNSIAESSTDRESVANSGIAANAGEVHHLSHISAPVPSKLIEPKLGGHLPVLDGIRGIAILFVLMYHQTNMSAVISLDRVFARITSWGWMGVDLFFVLSGFLITGILYDAKGSGSYFRNFYARRTLRIFPLYYLVILCYLVIFPHLFPAFSEHYGKVAGHGWWYWSYLSNFSLGLLTPTEGGVLNATWSLAVEEQFYLIWPTVVLLCNRKTLIRICSGMMVVALLVRTVMFLGHIHWLPFWHVNPMAIYALTPCRMDSLAAGALVALAARGSGGVVSIVPRARWVFAGTATFMFLAIVHHCLKHVDDNFVLASLGFTALAFCFASLLVLAITSPPNSLLSRALSQGWLRAFGRYSYALYLLHTPLQNVLDKKVFRTDQYHFASIHGSLLLSQFGFYILANGLTFLLALVSWNLFEKQFLKLKPFPMGRRTKQPTGEPSRESRPVANEPQSADTATAAT